MKREVCVAAAERVDPSDGVAAAAAATAAAAAGESRQTSAPPSAETARQEVRHWWLPLGERQGDGKSLRSAQAISWPISRYGAEIEDKYTQVNSAVFAVYFALKREGD